LKNISAFTRLRSYRVAGETIPGRDKPPGLNAGLRLHRRWS
jgi:hypothetical protein